MSHSYSRVYFHLHILVRVKTNECIERLIRIIKVKTSKFTKQLKGGHECFFWQIGYSKFSVSPSLVKKTAQYINNQEEHHKNSSQPIVGQFIPTEPETMGAW